MKTLRNSGRERKVPDEITQILKVLLGKQGGGKWIWACPMWTFLTGLVLIGAEYGISPIVPKAQVWFAEEICPFSVSSHPDCLSMKHL